MRCPKCHYISFESADRCRNCGYEFSLASVPRPDDPELPLNNRAEDPLPPVDLSLARVEGLNHPRGGEASKDPEFAIERLSTSGDLPLFKANPSGGRSAPRRPAQSSDQPIVVPSALPRAPIAVRRASADGHRMHSRYSVAELPTLDLDAPRDREAVAAEVRATISSNVIAAPPFRRMLAAVIDGIIVNGINAAVLYFTLKLCELPLSITGLLGVPPIPLVGFLMLLDAGYFITFTAVVGQTIGKMAMGLRVVHVNEAGEDENQPNVGFATLRTAAYGASILPLGLGFLPALISRDRRTLHDRLAETRVIFSGKLMV